MAVEETTPLKTAVNVKVKYKETSGSYLGSTGKSVGYASSSDSLKVLGGEGLSLQSSN